MSSLAAGSMGGTAAVGGAIKRGGGANVVAAEFLSYVNKTGSPYHSVEATKTLLLRQNSCAAVIAAGNTTEDQSVFQELKEGESWDIKAGRRYFVTRNNSAIAAIVIGENVSTKSGVQDIRMVAAHTDSPCLRVRPKCNTSGSGMMQLGVECYGGGLWHTWFDRGLGIAGKAVIRRSKTDLEERLVHIARPVAMLPNLAIHLQTAEERQAFKVHKDLRI
eukprot:GHVQ01011623.1.p1 GENE.GHVQ01011623.1~~GHVQ01011623.1.p1  ORF type:complete len:219 (-),score=38.72 GHVQ01011623.1:800-1456(-)